MHIFSMHIFSACIFFVHAYVSHQRSTVRDGMVCNSMMIYDGLVVQGKDTQILIILATTMYMAIHSKKKKFRNLITHQAQLPWPFHSHYNVSYLNL